MYFFYERFKIYYIYNKTNECMLFVCLVIKMKTILVHWIGNRQANTKCVQVNTSSLNGAFKLAFAQPRSTPKTGQICKSI